MADEFETITIKDKGGIITDIPCGSSIELYIESTSNLDSYDFQKWDITGGEYELIDVNSQRIIIKTINKDLNLTPVYKQKTCTITILSDDGKEYIGYYYKGETKPDKLLEYTTGIAIKADYNESITIQPYDREGYHFTGWDYKPEDNNVRIDENGNLIISPVTTSYVITPQYEIDMYTITVYPPAGINNSSITYKINDGSSINLPLNNVNGEIITLEYHDDIIFNYNNITGYVFDGWEYNPSNGIAVVNNELRIIDIKRNYTKIQPKYQQMVKLTVQKPDYVSDYTISYSSNHENGTIDFGNNTEIEKTFPKGTSVTVTASAAKRVTTNDSPCGGWEVNNRFTDDGDFNSQDKSNSRTFTLNEDYTIKPIYYYRVYLSLYPLNGIYNPVPSIAEGVVITQSGSSAGIPELSNAPNPNQTKYSNAGNVIPSIMYYPPKTQVTCSSTAVNSTDNNSDNIYQKCDWDMNSWWSATEFKDDSTTEYKIPSNIQNCLKPVREQIYTIPSLEKDMTIYGYPAPNDIEIDGFGLGYNNFNINLPSTNGIFYYKNGAGMGGIENNRKDSNNKFNMREDYIGYRIEGEEWDTYWGIRANLSDNNVNLRPQLFPFYYSSKAAFPLTLTISYTSDNNNNNLPVITDCRLQDISSNPVNPVIFVLDNTDWESQWGTSEYRTTVTIDLSNNSGLGIVDSRNWHLVISLS